MLDFYYRTKEVIGSQRLKRMSLSNNRLIYIEKYRHRGRTTVFYVICDTYSMLTDVIPLAHVYI